VRTETPPPSPHVHALVRAQRHSSHIPSVRPRVHTQTCAQSIKHPLQLDASVHVQVCAQRHSSHIPSASPRVYVQVCVPTHPLQLDASVHMQVCAQRHSSHVPTANPRVHARNSLSHFDSVVRNEVSSSVLVTITVSLEADLSSSFDLTLLGDSLLFTT